MATEFVSRLVETRALCPRCAMAEGVVEATGFCEACTEAIRAERYVEREHREAEARMRAHRDWWDRERQRRHRLVVKMRPTEMPSPDVDPLELGRQAINLLDRLRVSGALQEAAREQAKELVRQLAWGPDDPAPIPRAVGKRRDRPGQAG